jgi:hypothetical protein
VEADAQAIEAVYVVTKGEPAGPRAPLLPKGTWIEVRLADGSVSELQR